MIRFLPFCFLLQVEAIRKISEYVAQLRRVGKGHGMNMKIPLCLYEVPTTRVWFWCFGGEKEGK